MQQQHQVPKVILAVVQQFSVIRQQKTEQKASFPIVHSATNPPQPNHHRLSPTQQSVAEIASNEYAKGLMFFNAKRKREEEGEEEEETSSSDVAAAPLAQDASARDDTSPPPPKRLARKYYCKHPGCTNKRVKGGVCKRHEAEAYTYTCSIEGCTNDVIQDGVCMNHYSASVDTINELKQRGVLSAAECLLGLSRSNPTEVSTGADIRGPTASTDPVYNYDVRAIMKSSAIAVASPSVTKSGHKRYYCKANGCTNQVQKLGMCKRHGSEANKRHTYSYDGCNLTPEEASLVNIIIQDDNAPIEVITHSKVQDIMKQRKGRWIRVSFVCVCCMDVVFMRLFCANIGCLLHDYTLLPTHFRRRKIMPITSVASLPWDWQILTRGQRNVRSLVTS